MPQNERLAYDATGTQNCIGYIILPILAIIGTIIFGILKGYDIADTANFDDSSAANFTAH